MKPEQPAPGDQSPQKNSETPPKKKESKFMTGLKKVGFHIWVAVLVIGGALAFITSLFLV